jgi:hypothetical protein
MNYISYVMNQNECDLSRVERGGWDTLSECKEQNPCRKLSLHNPEGTGRVGRPAIRWLDSIEEDLKIMGVRKWRRKTQDRDQRKAIVEEAKVYCGL